MIFDNTSEDSLINSQEEIEETLHEEQNLAMKPEIDNKEETIENFSENNVEKQQVEEIKQENEDVKQEKNEKEIRSFGYSTSFDLAKLDKKSREILEETDESDYTFKLQDFEGPLDLLVHLIKITKIDIRDIFISNITEQYLKFMENLHEIDVEKASEFINMAATLLEIKSKHLLPKDPEIELDDGPNEEDFFRMVEEYKLIKDEMAKLAEAEDVNRFYKSPDSTVGNFRYELPDSLSIDALIASFSSLMQKVTIKAEAVQEKKIEKDKFTVAQKIAQIKDMLIEKKEFLFTDLFEKEHTKSEVINTFLALLELLKRQYIFVVQNELFDTITIKRNDDINERLTEEDIASEYDGEE